MLAGPETHRCIECGLPIGADRFHHWQGRIANGPAIWSDRGVLCSPTLAVAHDRKRQAEGTLRREPAPDPFETDLTIGRR
jgi:hypothetical protein